MATIRVVLALLHLSTAGLFNNTFLHGDLSEYVYMVIPPAVSTSRPNQCCKLLNSSAAVNKSIVNGMKNCLSFWFLVGTSKLHLIIAFLLTLLILNLLCFSFMSMILF